VVTIKGAVFWVEEQAKQETSMKQARRWRHFVLLKQLSMFSGLYSVISQRIGPFKQNVFSSYL
jgi:hypothetical protein